MARIRTIKPEFPQSESIGRLTREGRLCFILLWTLADDSGRLRGNSRMLASLLYPYDDDAKKHIDGWIEELERETCVQRYQVEGETFIQICNWLKHQKIDKPSPSKIPAIPDGFANPREDSRKNAADQGRDQGSRIKEGKGREGKPRETLIPENFGISERVRRWALEKKHDRLENYLEFFIGRMKANGKKYTDWDEAFMNCVREDWPKLKKQGAANGKFNVHAYTRGELAKSLAAEAMGDGAAQEIQPAVPGEIHEFIPRSRDSR